MLIVSAAQPAQLERAPAQTNRALAATCQAIWWSASSPVRSAGNHNGPTRPE